MFLPASQAGQRASSRLAERLVLESEWRPARRASRHPEQRESWLRG